MHPIDFAPDSIADTERAPNLAPRTALDVVLAKLGPDELRVLTRIADRLVHGRATYGLLDLASDSRAFRSREAREELEDALVYLACAWLKGLDAVP